MKRSKWRSVFNIAVALMLVFSIGYFSMLAPTTAWLSDAGQAAENYEMDELEISFDELAANTVTLDFDASTKFADDNERANMFEHTVQYYTMTVTNSGDLAGRLYLDIFDYDEGTSTFLTTKTYADRGLRWFMYSYNPDDDILITTVADENARSAENKWIDADFIPGISQVKASGKRVFNDGTRWFQRSPSLTDALEAAMVTADKATSNAGVVTARPAFAASAAEQTAFIQAENAKYITIPAAVDASTPSTVNIVVGFWVEYEPFTAIAANGSGLRTASYDIGINVNTFQDTYYE